jgi:predicted DNA-binding transcriptional regulator YafY
MKLEHVIRMISVMRASAQQAMTKAEIWQTWNRQYATNGRTISLRTIERHVDAMTHDGDMQGLAIEVARNGERAKRYYLDREKVARLLMPDDLALQMVLTRPIVEGLIARIGGDDAYAYAETVAEEMNGEFRELRKRVRVTPDGIGRLPARIDETVLAPIIGAITSRRCVSFEYRSSRGTISRNEATALGLVLKDGTQYLIAVRGFGDAPRHYAVHRIAAAEVSMTPAIELRDFDLDQYIARTHQLSHLLDAASVDIELDLRVSPETIYHLRERPLTEAQQIIEPETEGGWYQVRARIPNTILLVPWLLSMGGGIAVVAPEIVRTEMIARIAAMEAHYRDTPPA